MGWGSGLYGVLVKTGELLVEVVDDLADATWHKLPVRTN